MKITSLRIRVLKNTGNKMRGIVSINLDDMIAIHDIKILQNNDELFLAMPNRNTKAGGFKDSVHPINAEVREAVERIILGAYRFCLDNNYGNVQFDILTEFHATLLEESFSDFQLVNKEIYKFVVPHDADQVEEDAKTTTNKPQKSNAFLDWLNN